MEIKIKLNMANGYRLRYLSALGVISKADPSLIGGDSQDSAADHPCTCHKVDRNGHELDLRSRESPERIDLSMSMEFLRRCRSDSQW
jgi:hypothetical protein